MKMHEGKISKTGLFLLISEIIKTNQELFRSSKACWSNVSDSTSEQEADYFDKERGEKTIENDKKNDEESEKEEKVTKANERNKNKNNGTIVEHEEEEEEEEFDEKKEVYIISDKLKELGIEIGKKLAERLLLQKNDLHDLKDILKFIAKDMWFVLFNKNADKIQIFRKGIYSIVDNDVQFWLKHLLIDNETKQKNNFIHYFLIVITGIIKGALKRFNKKGYITYDLSYPQCSFQISINDES